MAVYKIEKCQSCQKYQRSEPSPKTPGPCPKCGAKMLYSDNWYISYKHNGKKYVEAIGPQKRMAEDAYAKARVLIREGKFFDKAPQTTWRKAVAAFRQEYKNNTSPKTQKMYDHSLEVLAPYFEGYTLDQITAQMGERFKAERSAQVTNSTVNRDLATLKRLFSLCEQWGFVEVNRIARVKLLKENASRTRFLAEDEIGSLLAECGQGLLFMAVLIALNTGLRKNEVLTLTWKELDLDGRFLEKSGKGGKVVKIPLTATLYNALIAFRKKQAVMSQYVLPAPKNPSKPIRVDSLRSFDGACKKAGIADFRFHDLRHTFASHFLMKTGNLKALQEILGHSDIKMTMRYSHLLDEHKRNAMEIFEKGVMNR